MHYIDKNVIVNTFVMSHYKINVLFKQVTIAKNPGKKCVP